MRRFFIFCLLVSPLLAACSSGVRDEQILNDLAVYQKDGGEASSALKITHGDGWSDGAEVRVYLSPACAPQDAQAKKCTEKYVSMSYQRQKDDTWKLLSVTPSQTEKNEKNLN